VTSLSVRPVTFLSVIYRRKSDKIAFWKIDANVHHERENYTNLHRFRQYKLIFHPIRLILMKRIREKYEVLFL
jgi:hypothetical protein